MCPDTYGRENTEKQTKIVICPKTFSFKNNYFAEKQWRPNINGVPKYTVNTVHCNL